jgi:protein-disulfide isomerase
MKRRKDFIISMLVLSVLFIIPNCTNEKGLNDLKNTQKEILAKLSTIEENQKKLLKIFQPRRPIIDYNKVYQIPTGSSPIKGNKNAPVTIVEFTDFQCPYCARVQPVLKEVLKAYPKEVKLVLKNYPLRIHQQARNAAKAAMAAAEQGKFWQMHDALFENYNKLSEEKFKELATKIGLDVKQFLADYHSTKYDKAIQEDIKLARKVGVTGTPTFFINGKRMRRRSFEDFKQAIDKILKK